MHRESPSRFISAKFRPSRVDVKPLKKVCITCKIEKEIEFFYKNEKFADGHQKECDTCQNERAHKKYNEKKKEREYFNQFMP